jgi:hypothetical protein
LPDGEWLLFTTAMRLGDAEGMDLLVIPTEGGAPLERAVGRAYQMED